MLERILNRIDKDFHCVDPLIVSVLTYKTDDVIEYHSKQVAIKHSRASRNVKTNEKEGVNNVDNALTLGSDLSFCKLDMNVKAQDGELFLVIITRN